MSKAQKPRPVREPTERRGRSPGGPTRGAEPVRYFRRGTVRIYLEPCARAFTLAAIGEPPAGFFACINASGLDVLATDLETGIAVVELPKRKGNCAAALRKAMRAAGLREGSVRIRPAYRRFEAPEDDIWAPTRRLSVRFDESWDNARIDALLKLRSLSISSAIDLMPNGFFVTVDEGDPIEAARVLVEQDGAIFAEPEFIRIVGPRRARVGPQWTPAEDWETREGIHQLHSVLAALGEDDPDAWTLRRELLAMEPKPAQPRDRWAPSIKPFAPGAAALATIREALAYARLGLERIEHDLLERQGAPSTLPGIPTSTNYAEMGALELSAVHGKLLDGMPNSKQ